MSTSTRTALRDLRSAVAAIDAADDFYAGDVRRHVELHASCIGTPQWLSGLLAEHRAMFDSAARQFAGALTAAVAAGCRLSSLRAIVGRRDDRLRLITLTSAESWRESRREYDRRQPAYRRGL